MKLTPITITPTDSPKYVLAQEVAAGEYEGHDFVVGLSLTSGNLTVRRNGQAVMIKLRDILDQVLPMLAAEDAEADHGL